jgi:hypothetical protein
MATRHAEVVGAVDREAGRNEQRRLAPPLAARAFKHSQYVLAVHLQLVSGAAGRS